jgi:hypothetical protein
MKRFLVVAAFIAIMILSAVPAAADSASMQEADALAFADFSDKGDAWLLRNDNGITARASLSGVPSGMYTMWWVVWNTPEGCFDPFGCLEPDLFNPDAGVAIGRAGGALVGPNGELNISAHLSEGSALSGFPYPEFQAIGVQLNENSMLDSRHAEIHLVFRYHGEKVPGLVAEATHTFNGACVYEGPIAGSAPAYGAPGPNTCSDLFFSIFPSESAP